MKYPIGVQNFESLRKDGYLYIDKTELIYKLVSGGRYYFLSRPRRFGKSLLISTLEAYFQGKKELFQGLAMEQLEKEWTIRPVLHIDLNIERYNRPENLNDILNYTICGWEKFYGSDPSETSLSLRFAGVVRRAHEQTGHRVAILVDEYDKPLLQAIGNKPLQEEYRSILKPFYGVLKTMDGHIRLAMLTGVTKFGKVSVFSDLNNLNDISMDDRYASLCGLTESEIHRYMKEGIQNLAATQHLTYGETCRKLEELYDGYHFTPGSEGIYNPFSILRTMDSGIFGSYWFETGPPTYLVTLLKQGRCDLSEMATAVTDAETLNSVYGDDEPLPVIYQSGYLTIKGYNPRFESYTLGFPNKEVEEGFLKFLVPYYTPIRKSAMNFELQKFVREIESGNVDSFMTRLQSFMADTPYELIRDQELHYQNVMFIVSKLLGFYVQAEYHTSQGRIDLLLQTDRFVYIMEFKLEGSAEEALMQIEDKNYTAPFASDPRKVLKVGINFSATTRNIDRWLVREA